MTADTVAELAGHLNIVGEKDSSGSIVQVAETISKTSPILPCLPGRPAAITSACLGAKGGTWHWPNVLPRAVCCHLRLFHSWKVEEACNPAKCGWKSIKRLPPVGGRPDKSGHGFGRLITAVRRGYRFKPLTPTQLEELKANPASGAKLSKLT